MAHRFNTTADNNDDGSGVILSRRRGSLRSNNGTDNVDRTSPETESPVIDGRPEESSCQVIVPPHWVHQRQVSTASTLDLRPSPIRLVDYTAQDAFDRPIAQQPGHSQNALNTLSEYDHDLVWARGVYIEDCTLAAGNIPNLGDFIVWNCRIDIFSGGTIVIHKRYSEFLGLRQLLLAQYPQHARGMPPFPPKSVVRRFKREFLERRRVALGYWLTCVLLNPRFCASDAVKHFVFG